MTPPISSKAPLAGYALFACFFLLAPRDVCQPFSLSLKLTNGQVKLAWPAGSNLVQPQKRTNLLAGAWQDLGAPTAGTNLTEAVGPARAYYRLRFLPQVGIYMGKFTGEADNGGFGVMLRSNGLTYVVGYNSPQTNGVFATNFSVALNGAFQTTTAEGGLVSGTFTTNAVSGNFTNSLGQPGSYSGNRMADTGTHAADVGYYSGTYSGALTGSAYAIIAADGTTFFFTSGSTGEGGGYGTNNAANSFSATTVPDGIAVTGTLNQATHVLSGSYSLSGTTLGPFSLTRTLTP
jgi:hypothetical protein